MINKGQLKGCDLDQYFNVIKKILKIETP